MTSRDSYSLPRIESCFDAFGGAKYFSTLDLCLGYYQVALCLASLWRVNDALSEMSFLH